MTRATWSPDCRDIIWINFSPQIGQEMKDMHPMMVLSPKKFNERTSIVIGLPMTTASYNNTNPFAIPFKGAKGKISYILAHQPKSFDWKKRGAKIHPWKQIPETVFILAREKLNQIIMLNQ